MKHFLIISLLFWGQITYLAAINPKPFVIPEIKEWKGAEGALTITANSRIVIDKEYVELRQIATLLAQDWALLFGKELAITTGKATRGDIQLSFTSSKKIGNEAYAIITTDRVSLSAATPTGLYWGTRTLLQIADQRPIFAVWHNQRRTSLWHAWFYDRLWSKIYPDGLFAKPSQDYVLLQNEHIAGTPERQWI